MPPDPAPDQPASARPPDRDDPPVLPVRGPADTDVSWGEQPEPDDDERLYRALLVATATQGNRVRLHAAMAQLRTLAGEATRPPARMVAQVRADCLHPATTDLYRDLLLGSPAEGGHPARL